jgi:hypothetical protein
MASAGSPDETGVIAAASLALAASAALIRRGSLHLLSLQKT